MDNKNLWELFLTTGDLNFYLELKKMETEHFNFGDKSEGIDYGGSQNIPLR